MTKLLICVVLLLSVVSVFCTDKSSTPTPNPTSSSSTSSSSSSSSSAAPQPTITPLPTIAPTTLYTLNYTNGNFCVMMNASIQLVVGYKNKSGHPFQVPLAVVNAASSGSCSSSAANLILQWTYANLSSIFYSMSFIMKADNASSQWNVSNVTAMIDVNNIYFPPNASPTPKDVLATNYSNLVPNLDLTRSYHCNSTQALNMTVENNSNTYNVTLNLATFQIQAFNFSSSDNYGFGKEQQCPLDVKGSMIVPIAVGAALAGLVIVVIVAYIIGRLRSRNQNSYEALS